jgi:hypothetical protein
MKVSNIRKKIVNDKVVVSALMELGNNRTSNVYFSVDKKYGEMVVADGSVFLPLALIAATKYKSDVVIDGRISAKLLQNASKVVELFTSWKLINHRVNIFATHTDEDRDSMQKIGCFFSGGVDSFYTYLKNSEWETIDALILVQGFDIDLKNKGLYAKVKANIVKVAENQNKKLIEVETNLRQFSDSIVEWDFAHGAAMACVALMLRRYFGKVYFSGGMPTSFLRPYGVHPDLDPLWSTESLIVVHEGIEDDRLAKIQKYISKAPIALETLRVCWKNPKGQYNCCECEKCLRTMLSLHSAGVLDKTKTFPKPINKSLLARLSLFPNAPRYYKENLEYLKLVNGDPGLILAIERCLYRHYHPTTFQKVTSFARIAIKKIDRRYLNGALYTFLSSRGVI